jgi:hypothetical protein
MARLPPNPSHPGIEKMDQGRDPGRFRPIGNLTSKIATTLVAKGTAMNGSIRRPGNSETDASQGRTDTDTPTITRHGVPTSSVRPSSLPAILARTELLAHLHRDPARLLPQCTQSSIAAVWIDCGAVGSGWDGCAGRYELVAPIGEDDRQSALAFLDDALAPAGEAFVIAELGRLRALTISRDVGQDLTLVLAVYADEMMRYPADAVREVLRGWRGKFWPAWAELADQLDRLVGPRLALRATLQRGYRKPEYSPDWTPPPTEDEKREVMELLERHGIRLDDRGRIRPLEREPVLLADMERAERELPEIRDMWIRRLLADETTAAGAA